METFQQLGIGFIQSLQSFSSPGMDSFMEIASFPGRIEFFLFLLPLIYWCVDRRLGFRVILLTVYTEIVSASLKILFHEPRPYWLGEVKGIALHPEYGLPSSHASSSMSMGVFLGKKVNKRWFWVFALSVVFLIGLSRVYLGVHFPHDVLLGWIIGLVVVWALLKWEKKTRDWLLDKPMAVQMGIGALDSLLIVATGLLVRFIVSGITDPASWSSFSVDSRAIAHFFTLAGIALGAYLSYPLTRVYARFDAKGSVSMRILRFVVGMVGVLAIYKGLDTYFATLAADETTLGYILRYIRYTTLVFWTGFLAPWLFLKLGLAKKEE